VPGVRTGTPSVGKTAASRPLYGRTGRDLRDRPGNRCSRWLVLVVEIHASQPLRIVRRGSRCRPRRTTRGVCRRCQRSRSSVLLGMMEIALGLLFLVGSLENSRAVYWAAGIWALTGASSSLATRSCFAVDFAARAGRPRTSSSQAASRLAQCSESPGAPSRSRPSAAAGPMVGSAGSSSGRKDASRP
jgi:hypothetical protein